MPPEALAGTAEVDVPPLAPTGVTARAVLADSELVPAVQVAGTDNPPNEPARPAVASTSAAALPRPPNPEPPKLDALEIPPAPSPP